MRIKKEFEGERFIEVSSRILVDAQKKLWLKDFAINTLTLTDSDKWTNELKDFLEKWGKIVVKAIVQLTQRYIEEE